MYVVRVLLYYTGLVHDSDSRRICYTFIDLGCQAPNGTAMRVQRSLNSMESSSCAMVLS